MTSLWRRRRVTSSYPGRAPGARWEAAGLGAVHLLVDAATIAAVYRAVPAGALDASNAFWLVVAYDLVAFAGQAPLGLLVDAARGGRGVALLGVILAALALATPEAGAATTLVLAGVGNALFHVGAGAVVLARSRGRAAPLGVFVAPGALGLAAGMLLGRDASIPAWPLVVVCAAAAGLLVAGHGPSDAAAPAPPPAPPRPHAVPAVVALCLASVAIRSHVAFASPRAAPAGALLAAGLPLVAFAGKLAGGFVADRVGWVRVGTGALVLCAPLLACSGARPGAMLAALLLLQATMPVTLGAVAEALPARPGLAFGLPCAALVAGALPTLFETKAARGLPALAGLALLSAAALWGALRLLRPPELRAVRLAHPVPFEVAR